MIYLSREANKEARRMEMKDFEVVIELIDEEPDIVDVLKDSINYYKLNPKEMF
jgi:hypothetical protein